MDRIRTAVADDERHARQRLLGMLAQEPDFDIVGECSNGRQVLELLQNQKTDLLFLDIEMPGASGFEVIEQLSHEKMPLVVFVTAYGHHAVRAFEVSALDYLLKPFDRTRLQRTLEKAKVQLSRSREGDQQQRILQLLENLKGKPVRDRFSLRSGERIFFVRADDVDWIEAQHNHVVLHVGKDNHMLREKIGNLETELDRTRFRRIHRSIIVNIDRIQEIHSWFRGDYIAVLGDGQKLTISRTYRDNLSDLLP
ncbi:MAG TPA: LytTR family DNA-binding domain-containing protein [Bryobacteraceae bacterium]|jgi:two-component system LytT family response regulator|nr:LytTR family DNA-binding domain-containing protein [Bryobacteraceae bacterium]